VPEGAVGCFGEDQTPPPGQLGYYGQCCVDVLCYTPDDGVCGGPDMVHAKLPGFPPGSGECSCVPEPGKQDVEGPFAGSSGSCCYLVGSIGCDGRPLLVAGNARLAAVRRRGDWLLS
jgi:hypothetical protein